MNAAVPVPFDVAALREWGELAGQPPLDQTELQKLWNQLIQDILDAASWIEASQPYMWRGVYPGMCLDPELCRGMTHCPRDYACND